MLSEDMTPHICSGVGDVSPRQKLLADMCCTAHLCCMPQVSSHCDRLVNTLAQ